jgi:hypothetical protein
VVSGVGFGDSSGREGLAFLCMGLRIVQHANEIVSVAACAMMGCQPAANSALGVVRGNVAFTNVKYNHLSPLKIHKPHSHSPTMAKQMEQTTSGAAISGIISASPAYMCA